MLIGTAKIPAGRVLMESPWGWAVLGTAVIEISLGAFLLWRGGMRPAWIPVVVFCMGLSGIAFAGPSLPQCYCLGDLVVLDARTRTGLSILMLSVALSGWGWPAAKRREAEAPA